MSTSSSLLKCTLNSGPPPQTLSPWLWLMVAVVLQQPRPSIFLPGKSLVLLLGGKSYLYELFFISWLPGSQQTALNTSLESLEMSRATAMVRCWTLNTTPTVSELRRDIAQFSGKYPPPPPLIPSEFFPQHQQQMELVEARICVPRDLLPFLTWAWTASPVSQFLSEFRLSSPSPVESISGLRVRRLLLL